MCLCLPCVQLHSNQRRLCVYVRWCVDNGGCVYLCVAVLLLQANLPILLNRNKDQQQQ